MNYQKASCSNMKQEPRMIQSSLIYKWDALHNCMNHLYNSYNGFTKKATYALESISR